MRLTTLSIGISILVIAMVGCNNTTPPPGGAGAVNTTPRQNAPTVETPGQNEGPNEVIQGEKKAGD